MLESEEMAPQRPQSGGTAPAPVTDTEIEAMLAACRVLVAISAQSIAAVDDTVDMPQFRALVVVASRSSATLGELADAAGMNMSTASRLCDRLVGMGLLNRTDDPANRRQLRLTLTDAGNNVVTQAMDKRRDALRPILMRLPKRSRAQLVELLTEFADAGGEPADRDLWSLGWPTTG
jgi:DNA-binding MarR family transcriptional regulator